MLSVCEALCGIGFVWIVLLLSEQSVFPTTQPYYGLNLSIKWFQTDVLICKQPIAIMFRYSACGKTGLRIFFNDAGLFTEENSMGYVSDIVIIKYVFPVLFVSDMLYC